MEGVVVGRMLELGAELFWSFQVKRLERIIIWPPIDPGPL